MLFTRDVHKPIYNSLHDLKSDKTINEWFNLAVYDESTLSQTAQEIDSILKKIPPSFLSHPPLSFKNFQSPHKQLTFSDVDDYEWFRQFFHSPKQLQKHYPLAILAFFDFSFLNFILEENPHVSLSRSLFKKSSDEKISSYYSPVSKFKMLLLRPLKNLPCDAEIPRFLEENDKYAKACGLSPLAIPHESQINRFKNHEITPIELLAIFYFMVTVAITHKIADSYLAAIDSPILDSHANPLHKTLTGSCKTCPYAHTCSHPAEWVSTDVNASFTVKHSNYSYGHKVHTMVDSVSNLVMGLFVSPSNLNDNPLFIPLLKVIDTIVRFRFKKYAADKGYDDKDNYHFVVNELKAELIIPHREETKTSPSLELFRIKDQVYHCTKVDMPLRPNGSDKKQNAVMFKCPNGFDGFSCPHATGCLKQGQTHKTFKVQIQDDLRIFGTPTTPKGSLQWKDDFKKRTSVERVFSDNKRVRQVASFLNFNLTAIFTHVVVAFVAHNLTVIFDHFKDTFRT
ncbi:transposase [Candidatus Jettenia caeni]|uniref:Transposase n=1 Tax=Candidatus Jettenia caeni TaxID=247490 RepID=I3IPK7_9BACT|nr:MAG: transposase [Candidatus Jettenia caeni]GAB63498.1 transposase [Candidatus Jettenia caeni]GAB63652.1 transposase [Candidatus Jettenia caeni]